MRIFYALIFSMIFSSASLASSELSQFWKSVSFTDLNGNSVSASLKEDATGDIGTYWLNHIEVRLHDRRQITLSKKEMARLVFPILSDVRLIESFGIKEDRSSYSLALKVPILGYVDNDGTIYESDEALEAIYILVGNDSGSFILREGGGHVVESRKFESISQND